MATAAAVERPAARFAKDHLKAFVERVERLEEEKKAIADDIRDVYAEAKANGFDVKALRMIIRLRKQDADERREQEAILETYMHALGMLNVTVRVKPTALPAKLSLVMPRCGSSENVAIMVEAGLSRYGPSARKSGTPYTVVFMKLCALGLTIMARIHGSLKRSPTRTTLGPLGGAMEGWSSLRLTAIVVSGAAGATRGVSGSVGSARATAMGVGCAA